MRLVWASLGVMALSACGSGADKAVSDPAAVEVAETSIPVEPDGGIGDGAEPLEEAEDAAQEEAPTDTIPAAYHGVWDATTGSCSPESDARLEISATELMFYESVGTVTSVEAEDDIITVSVAMSGEGETWEDSYIFVLENGNLNTLMVGTNSGFERMPCPTP